MFKQLENMAGCARKSPGVRETVSPRVRETENLDFGLADLWTDGLFICLYQD
jgi:hypothetical protein